MHYNTPNKQNMYFNTYLGKSPLVNIHNTQTDDDNISVTSSVLQTNENLRLADINATHNFNG